MPKLFAWLAPVFLTGLVSRVLVGLGFGIVSYIGINILLDTLMTQIIDSLGRLPLSALQILGLLRVDLCINIIVSAFVARLTLTSLSKLALRV